MLPHEWRISDSNRSLSCIDEVTLYLAIYSGRSGIRTHGLFRVKETVYTLTYPTGLMHITGDLRIELRASVLETEMLPLH